MAFFLFLFLSFFFECVFESFHDEDPRDPAALHVLGGSRTNVNGSEMAVTVVSTVGTTINPSQCF